MSFYQSIAPYYDYIFQPSLGQVDFIAKAMDGLKNRCLLEAGCGTGNLVALLAEEGARVEGVDLDQQMVKQAYSKYRDLGQTSFRVLSILNLMDAFTSESFDGVVSFGNTLVHLNVPQELSLFFRQVGGVLKPGGQLMGQIINYDRILDKGLSGLPTIENDHIRFERYYDVKDVASRLDFRTVLTVKASGKVIRNRVSLFPLRKQLLKELLRDCGFSEISFFGDFKRSRLLPDSVPLVFLARWPK